MAVISVVQPEFYRWEENRTSTQLAPVELWHTHHHPNRRVYTTVLLNPVSPAQLASKSQDLVSGLQLHHLTSLSLFNNLALATKWQSPLRAHLSAVLLWNPLIGMDNFCTCTQDVRSSLQAEISRPCLTPDRHARVLHKFSLLVSLWTPSPGYSDWAGIEALVLPEREPSASRSEQSVESTVIGGKPEDLDISGWRHGCSCRVTK